MRLSIAFIALLLTLSIPVTAQNEDPKAARAIDSIENVDIGMSADTVISALTKKGFTLIDVLQGKSGNLAVWNVSLQDKYLGSFDVENGQVSGVEVPVYTGQDHGSGDFGDALYWILYDNGQPLPSKDRDWRQASTDVHFTTRDIAQRSPGSSFRMIFVDMSNGANYRITLFRNGDGKSSSFVTKVAPFVKTK